MDEVLIQIAKVAPVIAVLVIALRYFLRKEKLYQKQIKDLNDEIRQSEKDNLDILDKLANVIEKLSNNVVDNRDKVLKEIIVLKEYITLKLDNLKDDTKKEENK